VVAGSGGGGGEEGEGGEGAEGEEDLICVSLAFWIEEDVLGDGRGVLSSLDYTLLMSCYRQILGLLPYCLLIARCRLYGNVLLLGFDRYEHVIDYRYKELMA
jgi:hypothetical protein